MGKIKINLVSGNVVEKPLITCFKNAMGTYLVLDNEANGTMGYPIICISKFNGQNAEKIIDQAEWTSVKESLKTIISGTNLPYENVPEVISAQDNFFTQLTLPLASFELLKNVYNAAMPSTTATAPSALQVESAPVVDTPVVETPIVTPNISAPEAVSVMPQLTSMNLDNPTTPVQIEAPVSPTVSEPVISPIQETPNINDTELANMKETFMKSCENMFDALVKKFQNK